MYNYGAPGYMPPPGYGGAPPGMAPPGMGPPGMGPPPGIPTPGAPGVAPSPVGGSRGLPPNWHPPANMPNINFNAPVIRLGTNAPQHGGLMDGRRDSTAAPSRRGLGMDSHMRDGDGQRARDQQALYPPTREEIARTIFVGNIPEGVRGDEGMERILATAGNLARWIRVTDANNKPQTFGFAEYEDAQSLETAAAVFKNVEVPTKLQEPGGKKEAEDFGVKKEEGDADVKKEERESGVKKEEGEPDVREEEDESGIQEEKGEETKDKVEKTKLLIMVDDASIKYAEEWKARRGDDEAMTQFRIDQAKEALEQVLTSLFHPPLAVARDHDGDMMMSDARPQMLHGDGVEVVNINIDKDDRDDELALVPPELRETVAAEIAAFRDRSTRRDKERLRREEEIEAEERRRARRASPPTSAPTGPGGANGVPLGPRADRGVQGAPSGPKGSQFPRDYQGGVNFINGGAINNNGVYMRREDEDDSASDDEIENRRLRKKNAELDELYARKLGQWNNHERRNATSLERSSGRAKDEEAEKQRAREAQANFLENFDDDVEASRKAVLFFRDHSEYMREREKTRNREQRDDDKDRQDERRETAAVEREKEVVRVKEEHRQEQAEDLSKSSRLLQPFKLSLGAAAKKVEAAAAPRRTVAEIENLLEDEEGPEEAPTTKKRTLVPINYNASVRANLTPEEVVEAQQQLAREIPSNLTDLWKWEVAWDHLPSKAIDGEIRQWAEKKILDIMGIQEDLLVESIVDHLKAKRPARELVESLEVALDEEAEDLVRKLWRMVIYYSEVEKRGIK